MRKRQMDRENRRKIWIGIAIAVITLVLIFGCVVGILFWKITKRLESFQDGFSFEAEYQVVLSEQEKSADDISGMISGEKGQEVLHVTIIPAEKEELATELYSDGTRVLIHAEKIYEGLKMRISKQQPLVGALMPDWSAGSYISFVQLEEVTGKEMVDGLLTERVSSGGTSLAGMQYMGKKDGRLYFQVNADRTEDSKTVIGIRRDTLFRGAMDCVLFITKGQYQISLSAKLKPELASEPQMPESTDIMTEEEVGRLKAVYEAVEKAIGLLGKVMD